MGRSLSSRAPLVLALVLAAVVAFVSFSYLSTPQFSDGTTTSPTIMDISNAILSVDASSCGLCKEIGACDHAFKGAPGRFCLSLASGVPCCCPQDAECVLSTSSSCSCRRSGAVSVTTTTTTTTHHGHGYGFLPPIVVYIIVGIVGVFYSFYCIYECCCRSPYDPVSSSSQYGSINNGSSGSGSTALGALSGFATGMLAGSMMRGRDDDVTTTTTTTTTIGGGDFAGDAGGGDDFAGDV